MGTDDRVVLRSSWWAAASMFVALTAAAWVGTVLAGGTYPPPVMVGTFAVCFVLFQVVRRTVLTAEGLELSSFRRRLISWSQVTGVVVNGTRWNQRYLTVRLPPDRPWVKLPAPVAPWGVGTRQVVQAGELVDQWRVRHSIELAPVPPSPGP